MLSDILLFPEYQETFQTVAVPAPFKAFVDEAGSIGAPAGFLGYTLSLFPVLVLALAIIGGTGALAGEESAGTLDLLLAQPATRTRIVLERAAGLGLALALDILAMFPGFLLGAALVDIDLGAGRMCATLLTIVLLALLVLALSLWASATFPNRTAAAMVAGCMVVAAFFVNVLGGTVDALDGPRRLSPFYWADPSHSLLHGFDWLRAGGLLVVAALFLGLALHGFQQRDVAAGGREWRWRWKSLGVRRQSAQEEARETPAVRLPRPKTPLSRDGS